MAQCTKVYTGKIKGNFILIDDFSSLILHDKDKKDLGLHSHIEGDDYFGTLATIIDLMFQKKTKNEKKENELLERLKNDLVYLQKNYRIVKK